jgi:hypothetical protein
MATGSTMADTRRARPAAYVVFFALLFLQVGYASHQHDHAIGELTDSCEVCAQADQSDGVAVAPQTAEIPRVAQAAPVVAISRIAASRQVSRYQARAPPLA